MVCKWDGKKEINEEIEENEVKYEKKIVLILISVFKQRKSYALNVVLSPGTCQKD